MSRLPKNSGRGPRETAEVLSWYGYRPHKGDAGGIRLWTQQVDQIQKNRELAA